MELLKKYKTLLTKYGVTTPRRQAMFLAQLDHESGLKPVSENLNYSADRLLVIFKKYFNSKTAQKYARNPKMIANLVYANRMGNGSEASGDGWKYRGRGFIQTTGKTNYSLLSQHTGIDYVNNPDLLLNEADAMIAALYYWQINNLNYYSDLGDVDAVSDLINIGRRTSTIGDAHGYQDRKNKYNMYLSQISK